MLPFDYAARNLARSPVRLLLSVGGSALVVLLVLVAGGFVHGMQSSLSSSTTHENVMLLGAGSEDSVERSEINAGTGTQVAASVSGIKEAFGTPYVSPEVHLMAVFFEAAEGEPGGDVEREAIIRGVTPAAMLVHEAVHIDAGRFPRAGRDELLVGERVHIQLGLPADRLAVGETLWFDDRPWTIVGRLAAARSVMAGEIWMPLTDLQEATQRDTISTVVLTLDEAEFADIDAFRAARFDLELAALRESEYYAGLRQFFQPVQIMVWLTAGLIAIGGLLGGLNTMYAAFASRVREIGTLQTLGFSRGAIALSLITESLLTAAIGAVIALTIALALLGDVAITFSMGVFGLSFDPPVLLAGLVAAVLLGLVGALPPVIRCLRLPITEAVKA